MKPSISGVVAFTMVVLAAAPAQAADICFQMDATEMVAKSFSAPKPGKCKALKGAYFTAFPAIAVGSACTNTAGDTLRVVWTTHDNFAASTGRIDLAYPGLATGTYEFTTSEATDSVVNIAGVASAASCSVPIP